MAAFAVLRPILQEMLADPESDNRSVVRDAVSGATSVGEAAERAHLFATLSEAHAAEGRAVLDALPPEADRQILDALNDGIERGVPISLDWREHTDIGAEVSAGDQAGSVHIELHSPDGREFLA